MKLAIMQPYLFPYLGYFQLVNAVDKFVFYDDVNYIKGGWINRNRILINSKESMFTIPLQNASSFKSINEVEVNGQLYPKWKKKFLRSINQSYSKAPFYADTFELIESILSVQYNSIADIAIASVEEIFNFLELSLVFERSSLSYSATKQFDRTERIIQICKLNNANTYINAANGKELYNKSDFAPSDIELFFIENTIPEYPQFSEPFVKGLSIIDVLMFNSKSDTASMLEKYSLS